MSFWRKCDVCGFTDSNVEAIKTWGSYSGRDCCLDLCPVCSAIVKSRIRTLRDERRDKE